MHVLTFRPKELHLQADFPHQQLAVQVTICLRVQGKSSHTHGFVLILEMLVFFITQLN